MHMKDNCILYIAGNFHVVLIFIQLDRILHESVVNMGGLASVLPSL